MMSIKNLESFFRRTTFLRLIIRLIKKIRREAFRRFSLLSKKETEVKKEKSFVFSKFFSFFLYYHCPFYFVFIFSFFPVLFLFLVTFFLFFCPFPFFFFFFCISFFCFLSAFFFSFVVVFFPFFCQNRSVGEERGYLEFYIKKQRRNFGESEKKEKYDSEA